MQLSIRCQLEVLQYLHNVSSKRTGRL